MGALEPKRRIDTLRFLVILRFVPRRAFMKPCARCRVFFLGDSHRRYCSHYCSTQANVRHGHARKENGKAKKSPEYRIWQAMIQRCTKPQCRYWSYYGGRGIQVCDRWRRSFASFLADIGLRPSPELTLDRIDNNRGYEPGNLRWASRQEQQYNTRLSAAERSEACRQMARKRWCK